MAQVENFKITVNNVANCTSFKVTENSLNESGAALFITISAQASPPSLTVNEFANKASVTPQAVRKMILEGRLEAVNLGKQYLIGQDELDRYLLKR
jgi:excisionase family DNA binding protein